jgi:hypothetical protein
MPRTNIIQNYLSSKKYAKKFNKHEFTLGCIRIMRRRFAVGGYLNITQQVNRGQFLSELRKKIGNLEIRVLRFLRVKKLINLPFQWLALQL